SHRRTAQHLAVAGAPNVAHRGIADVASAPGPGSGDIPVTAVDVATRRPAGCCLRTGACVRPADLARAQEGPGCGWRCTAEAWSAAGHPVRPSRARARPYPGDPGDRADGEHIDRSGPHRSPLDPLPGADHGPRWVGDTQPAAT